MTPDKLLEWVWTVFLVVVMGAAALGMAMALLGMGLRMLRVI